MGQIGKRADIAWSTVDELGATLGCRGALIAPEHAEKEKVADEERWGLLSKPGACEIADVGDDDTANDLPAICQACGARKAN